MRNNGHLQNRVFFIDETQYSVEVESLERQYSSWPVANNDVLARDASAKWKKSLRLSESFQRKNLDAAELATFTQLLFATYEADLFLNEKARRTYVDIVSRELNEHCVHASKDFALVFDRIASLLVDFRDAFQLFCEKFTIHDLLLPERLDEDSFVLLQTFRFRKRFAEPSA
ncbi:hypothetical protein AAVH_40738 [Aphelenchoides avenae]|nr:hypothetical protein AAVH_40738 [Aphelenchus avenae]